MANAFNSTVTLGDLVETAFDMRVGWALRSKPQFRSVIDKHPEQQAMPGDVVVLTLQSDLPLATTPLAETVDPDAVARPAPSRVSVTIQEYGNTEINTLRLLKLGFTSAEREMAMTIARNMADSMDRLVRNVMDTGTQTLYMDNDATIDLADPTGVLGNMTAKLAAIPPANMREDSVDAKDGDIYVAFVHPHVSYDLRVETGDTGWLKPHSYVDTRNIYAGEIGEFVGNKFIETPRVAKVDNGGGDVRYTSYFMGREAIVEASVVEPHTVIGPVVDKLKRFFPLGWYAMMGHSLYRNEALWRVTTNSSLAGL